MDKNGKRCPVCNGQLGLLTSRVLSYRLVLSVEKPLKRQEWEVVATLKWCLCGYSGKEMNERMLEEVEV